MPLDTLYAEHHASLLAFLRARLPREAEEIAQEVWLRGQKELAKPGAVLTRSWLFKVARNLMMDSHRRRKPEMLEVEVPARREEVPLFDEDHRAIVRGCLEGLKPDYRMVIVAVSEGCTPVEIAERFGISRANADQRKSRGLAQLKDCVEGKSS